MRQCDIEVSGEADILEEEDEEDGEKRPLSNRPSREKPMNREDELRNLRKAASLRPPPDGNISQSMEVRRPLAIKQKAKDGGEPIKLIAAEEFQAGGVKWSSYWLIIREMTISMAILVFFGYLIANVFFLFSNMWVAQWCQTNQTNADGTVNWKVMNYEVGIYATLTICQCKSLGVLHKRLGRLFLFWQSSP